MRTILVIVLVLVVAVAGLGFYLEWWGFSSSRDADTGQKSLHFNVNTNKIKGDTEKAKQKLTGGSKQAKEKPQEE